MIGAEMQAIYFIDGLLVKVHWCTGTDLLIAVSLIAWSLKCLIGSVEYKYKSAEQHNNRQKIMILRNKSNILF